MRKRVINENRLIKFPTEAEALEYVDENELDVEPYKRGDNWVIEVPKFNEIQSNFYDVLECAYEDYYAHGKGTDIAAICLGKLEESVDNFELVESLLSGCGSLLFEGLNEDGTNVNNAKIVKERKGTGLSVLINGKEYRYVSPTQSTEDLYKEFTKQLEVSNTGFRALNWLKKNALCYYGCKKPEGKELVGMKESLQESTHNHGLVESMSNDFGYTLDEIIKTLKDQKSIDVVTKNFEYVAKLFRTNVKNILRASEDDRNTDGYDAVDTYLNYDDELMSKSSVRSVKLPDGSNGDFILTDPEGNKIVWVETPKRITQFYVDRTDDLTRAN